MFKCPLKCYVNVIFKIRCSTFLYISVSNSSLYLGVQVPLQFMSSNIFKLRSPKFLNKTIYSIPSNFDVQFVNCIYIFWWSLYFESNITVYNTHLTCSVTVDFQIVLYISFFDFRLICKFKYAYTTRCLKCPP